MLVLRKHAFAHLARITLEGVADLAREVRVALHEAGRLFTIVDGTTEKLLDFNDKYLETDDLSSLNTDLSSLGETLEIRFSAEDRMISVLHTSHKDLVNG